MKVCFLRSAYEIFYSHFFVILLITFTSFLLGCSDQKKPSVSGEEKNNSVIRGMIVAPGLKDPKVIAPLEDAWKRIDPKEDGWDSEVLNEVATKKLKALSEIILSKTLIKEKDLEEIESDEYKGSKLRPKLLNEIYKNEEFVVKRGLPDNSSRLSLRETINELLSLFNDGPEKIALKLYKIDQLDSLGKKSDSVFKGRVLVNISGNLNGKYCQINSEWETLWSLSYDSPKLKGIDVLFYEEVIRRASNSQKLFIDVTRSVFRDDAAYTNQLLKSTDHWRSRIARDFGLDVVANHGIALGDVNGDGLDDLYVCQQGGLPNRLFLRQKDGSLKDITKLSNTGWLEICG